MTMRSLSSTASSTSWVTNTTGPAGARNDLQQLVLQLRAGEGIERAEGLVHQQQLGSIASARAMPTRCFIPPEISCGRSAAHGPFRPARARPGYAPSAGPGLLRAEDPLDRRCTFSWQVSHGSSEWFWKTTARSGPGEAIRGCRTAARQRLGAAARQSGQQRRLAAARVADQRTNSPLATVRWMSCSAWKGPFGLEHHLGAMHMDEALVRRQSS